MKNIKKSLSFLLSIALLTSVFSLGVFASSVEATSGICGENLTWTLDSEGTLTISGEGEMYGNRFDSIAEKIKSIIIEDGVTSIGYRAFSVCPALKSVTVGNTLEIINMSSFYGCSNLESVTLGNSIKTIGYEAFYGCSSLKTILIPESLTQIDGGAFYGCSSLESFSIPKNVTSIGNRTFVGCSSLKSITGHNDITSIGELAFTSCTMLEYFTIGDSIETIGIQAFHDTKSLKAINVSENNKNFSSVDGVLFDKNKTTLIIYPKAKTNDSYKIPDSVTSIEKEAFSCCLALKSIEIPDSVNFIGGYAFNGCESLEYINIPNSVDSIEDCAFNLCTSLEYITLPRSVTRIGTMAFLGCSSLKEVTIVNPDAIIESYSLGQYYSQIGTFENYENFTITGVKNSTAEKYATENGFDFISLDITTIPENEYYLDKEEGTMPNVVEKTTASDIISTLELYGINATITDKEGNAIADNKFVGTGCKVVIADIKYTVIVKGDVDGDGSISTTDYLSIKAALLGGINLQNEYKNAADCDKSGAIDTSDYLKVKSYFLGSFNLYA